MERDDGDGADVRDLTVAELREVFTFKTCQWEEKQLTLDSVLP